MMDYEGDEAAGSLVELILYQSLERHWLLQFSGLFWVFF